MKVPSDSQIFPFLKPAEEQALLDAAVPRTAGPNEIIVDQDASLAAILVIKSGAVRVEHRHAGGFIPLAVLEAGEFFGEMSFVDGAPASARVVALDRTQLRMIDAQTIERAAASGIDFGERLYRSIAAILAQRLRLTSQRVTPDQSWG